MQIAPISEKTRQSEVWFVLAAIILLNGLFIGAISAKILRFGFYSHGRFLLLAMVLAVLVGFFRGTGGLVGLVRPMTVWRVAPGWYLLAVAWPPLMSMLVLWLKKLGTGAAVGPVDVGVFSNAPLLITIFVASFVGEIVWVSYAINRLAGRWTVLEASLVVGVFWTLWWMPIVLLGVGVIPGLPLGALLLNMLGIAVMCGFVYSRTRSGLVVLIMQVTLNSTLLVFPVLPHSGGINTFWLFALVYLVAAVLLHVAFGQRPLLSLWRSALPTAGSGDLQD